jgi:predicted GNAT family N-acyltransferase
MAVLPEWRGQGVGSQLLRRLIAAAGSAGMRSLALSAQTHAASFYTRLGFAAEGDEFLEAGIRHVRMSCLVPD